MQAPRVFGCSELGASSPDQTGTSLQQEFPQLPLAAQNDVVMDIAALSWLMNFFVSPDAGSRS